jgi:methionine-S-sulfoxide reductase
MTEERAVLAGGCFWGMQDLIRRQPGVISTRVGYTGGTVRNATYRNHEGHAEAIEIVFDSAKTSYRTLLEFFFQIHDPTTLNRQGNDRGTSYRSAIFYTSDEQRKVAEDTIADVEASHLWRITVGVCTDDRPLNFFQPAFASVDCSLKSDGIVNRLRICLHRGNPDFDKPGDSLSADVRPEAAKTGIKASRAEASWDRRAKMG